MERDNAIPYIRANWRIIILHYTKRAKTKVNGEYSYICGIGTCTHGKGGDGLTVNPDSKDGNGLKCFGCGWAGDIIDYVMIREGIDFNTALHVCADILGITIDPYRPDAADDFKKAQGDSSQKHAQRAQEAPQSAARDAEGKNYVESPKTPQTGAQDAQDASAEVDYTEYYLKCRDNLTDPAAVSYLQGRGISIEIARKYYIGYDPKGDPYNAPGGIQSGKYSFPAPRFIEPGSKSFYFARRIDGIKDYEKMNCGSPALFNGKALYAPDAQEVFIVEGAFDALSFLDQGAAAVALNSTSNADLLIKQLNEKPTGATLILCLDNDDAGKKAAAGLEETLSRLGVSYINATADICRDGEDPNEALVRDKAAFVDAIRKAQEKAKAHRAAQEEAEDREPQPEPLPEPVKDELTQFWEKIQTEAYKPHKTGLDFFDDLLGGGVIMQTVLLILAAPATGKTTLCQTIAEEIAKRGKPVIYLNLEMSKEQMFAKSISAKVSKDDRDNPMTINDVLQGYKWTDQQRQRVFNALAEYREKIHPFIKYNPDKVGSDIAGLIEYLEKQGEKAKKDGNPAPAVVLDYLHLITSETNIDIQELIKKTVNGIKDYCMKYNTFAILISATNRNKGRITMESGRDSSNIEFGGDALISLNYWEIDQEIVNPAKESELAPIKEAPYRHMILRVLKARFYQAGRYSKFYYHPATNIFFGEHEWLPVGGDNITPFPLESAKGREDQKEKSLKESEIKKRASIPRR